MEDKKKKILVIGGIILIIVLVFGTVKLFMKHSLIIETTSDCDYKAKLYYESNNKKVYTYCLDKVEVNNNDNIIELNEYLKENSIDELVEKFEKETTFLDGGTSIYKDGGSKKITNNGVTIIKCSTLDGNKDIFIGSKDMDFKDNFCRTNIATFTRTYTIVDVNEYKEQQYEDGVPVTYGKSLKVTLSQYQGETKTVIINNLWDKLTKGKTYEFEFMLKEGSSNIQDSIEEIFKNASVVEVRETTKEGKDQRVDPIE